MFRFKPSSRNLKTSPTAATNPDESIEAMISVVTELQEFGVSSLAAYHPDEQMQYENVLTNGIKAAEKKTKTASCVGGHDSEVLKETLKEARRIVEDLKEAIKGRDETTYIPSPYNYNNSTNS